MKKPNPTQKRLTKKLRTNYKLRRLMRRVLSLPRIPGPRKAVDFSRELYEKLVDK